MLEDGAQKPTDYGLAGDMSTITSFPCMFCHTHVSTYVESGQGPSQQQRRVSRCWYLPRRSNLVGDGKIACKEWFCQPCLYSLECFVNPAFVHWGESILVTNSERSTTIYTEPVHFMTGLLDKSRRFASPELSTKRTPADY